MRWTLCALALAGLVWSNHALGQIAAAVDDSGRIYVADWNAEVGQFENVRQVSTVRGSGTKRGLVIGDFNEDGIDDMIVGTPSGGWLWYHFYPGNAEGEWVGEKIVGEHPREGSYQMEMAAGDVNNDGHLDIVTGGNNSWNSVLLGDGTGHLSRVWESQLGGNSRGMDLDDFNGDGVLDLVRARCCDGIVNLYPGVGDGTFGGGIRVGDAGSDPYGLVAGDFNGDGHADVIANEGGSGNISFWAGNGDGTFEGQPTIGSLDQNNHGSFGSYDYDQDGDLDIVAVNYTGRRFRYFENNGDGTFLAPVDLMPTTTNTLGATAPLRPPLTTARAALAPAELSVEVNERFQIDGSGTEGASRYVWHFGDNPGPQGNGAPGVVEPVFFVEGTYPITLRAYDDQDRASLARVNVAVTGEVPIIDDTPINLGEAEAVDGEWRYTFDSAELVAEDQGLEVLSWSAPVFSDDFEDGIDEGWWLTSGTWVIENDLALGGGASLRQTNAGADRTRILFRDARYVGDVEIEFDVRMVQGAGKEIHLLFGGRDIYNNYEVILRGRGQDDFLVYRRTNDSARSVMEVDQPNGSAVLPFDSGRTYHVLVRRIGIRIEAYVDGLYVGRVWDNTFTGGLVGFSTYRTDAIFDNLQVRALGSDETFQHLFQAPGVYNVDLMVSDGAGQVDEATIPVIIEPGDPPVAEANGPYVFDEQTGNANNGVYSATVDGAGSSDPDDSPLRYLWDFGAMTFDGDVLDTNYWITARASQDDALRTVGNGRWGQSVAFTRGTFARAPGLTFEAKINATNRLMVGWKNESNNGHYNQYVYALYFNNGQLRVYENGSDRGLKSGYTRGADYDVRIVMKDGPGARYYYRRTGEELWRLVYDSGHSNHGTFRVGYDVLDGTGVLDDWRMLAAGSAPTMPLPGPGEYPVTLTVTDAVGQSATDETTVTLEASAPPVADAGGDQAYDETTGVRGLWTVPFDATASADDVGIASYEWDFNYDAGLGFVPSGTTGAQVEHVFEAGVYRVAVRVTDHARQQDIDVVTLTITPGNPPIADPGGGEAGGPYVVDEFTGEASGGGFTVTLDGTGSSDAESEITYSWDLGTDTFRGGVNHDKWRVWEDRPLEELYPADACAYEASVNLIAGRRYALQCPAVCAASNRLWGTDEYVAGSRVCLAAVHANVLAPGQAGRVEFEITGAGASYEGTLRNGIQSANHGASRTNFRFVDASNTGLHITGRGSWGTRFAYTRDAFPRVEGYFMEMTVRTSHGSVMFGLKTVDENPEYRSFHYAIYFNGTNVLIYESGANRGDTGYDVANGVDYDLRIEPKVGAGARYYIRRADEEAWTLLYNSNHSNLGSFRAAVDVHGNTAVVSRFRDIAGGPEPTVRVYGSGERTVSLTVTDQANQTDSAEAVVRTQGNDLPVAEAGDDLVLGEAEAEGGQWTVTFDGSGSTDDHGIYRYEWDFDYDGGTFDVDAVGIEADHTFAGPGFNVVALRVTDHALQTHIDTLDVDHQGSEPPIANAGQNMVTEGVWPVRFDGSRSTDDIQIARLEWDFGDGTTGVGARPRHSYWAPGVYQVTLTVYDRADQSDTDTIRVVVREASDPPVAEAGEGYRGGAGGPPAHFDGTDSADDFGVAKHYWDVDITVDSNEDGDPANDVDVVGPTPMWTYAEVGEYTIQLTVTDGAGQTATDQAVVSIVENLPPEVVTVPWVATDPRSRHHIINNRPVRLKAIARDAGALTYQWDFGDGSPPWPEEPAPVARKDVIEATHTYPESPVETPFVATLTVWDEAGESSSDIYPLIVQPNDLDTETNLAIEEALWWLHRAQRDDGWWETRGYYTSPTASANHAFVIHGHLPFGDNRENPYVETTYKGFHYLFRRLRSFGINGATDTNGNGLAIDTNGGRDPYQMGTPMDALASTNQPLFYAPSGDAGIFGRYYHELVWDMADAYIWGQSGNGGWYYSWRSGGADNSAAQWGAIGLIAANENFRIPIPQSTKDRNMAWLRRTASGSGFGYSGAGGGAATTPSGMVQLVMNDVPLTDPLWVNAERYMANRWQPWSDNEYSLFAQTKALRLAGLTHLSTGLDWFDDPVNGLRRRIINHKLANHTRPNSEWGKWRNSIGWTDDEMATAWGVVMLTPTLFQQPPVADAGRDVTWGFDIPLPFDASASTHRDALRELVKFEWDFDGDGTYDLITDDPSDPRAVFTYPDPQPDVDGNDPEIYYVRLRVTDDNVPPQIDTDIRVVTVKDPPYAPFADIGGPYRAAAGVPFQLDASASFDLDPQDRILRYQWDLSEQGPFFEEIDVDTGEPVIAHTFPVVGRYVIGLRVRDVGFFNPPNCVVGADCVPQTSEPVFTTVEVVENQPPLPAIEPIEFLGEGEVLRVDAGPSIDPESAPMAYQWGCEGIDVVEVEGTGGRAIDIAAGERDFPEQGVAYPCRLTVIDIAGATAGLDFEVRAINRPPVVEAVVGQNGVEAGQVPVRITATDPAPADAERLVYSVDCDGDGVIDIFDALVGEVECTYADNGVYVIAGVVDDDDGGQAVGFSAPITIANLDPMLAAPPCPAAVEGIPVPVQLATSDPAGAADPILCSLQPPVPDGAQLDAVACRLLWTPTYEQASVGMVRFGITARDDDGGLAEAELVCTPRWQDEDGDGLPDTWERDNDLDPEVDDCAEGLDADGDGISNCDEWERGTDPQTPDLTTPPVLVEPIDQALVETATPELVLENASDSLGRPLSYEYEVYADAELLDLVTTSELVDETVDTTAWPVADGLLAQNSWYWWRARAFNGDDFGPWAPPESFLVDSDPQPPTPPTIVWPADGDAIAVLQPSLLLDESTDPDVGDTLRYVCEISRDAALFQPITGGEADDAVDGPQTEVPTADPLDENAAYRARCKAIDSTGLESAWSNIPRFTINLANDPPTAPSIIRPEHASTIARLDPTLVAGPAVDPEGEPLTYMFWLSDDPTFPEGQTWISEELPLGEDGLIAFPAPEALTDNTFYFWRVRARDPFVGGPAASARFRVDLGNEPPSVPQPLDPPDTAVMLEQRPLVWAGSIDPDGDPITYELLLIGLDNDVFWSLETPDVTAEYPEELALGRYRWRVRARDDRGGQSDWSTQYLFTIAAPIPPPPPDMGVDEPDLGEQEPDLGGDIIIDRGLAPDPEPDLGGDNLIDRGLPDDDMGPPDMDPPDEALPETDAAPEDDAEVDDDADIDSDAEVDEGDDLPDGTPPGRDMDVDPDQGVDEDDSVDEAGGADGTVQGGADGGDSDGWQGFGAYTGSQGCVCDAAGEQSPVSSLWWLLGVIGLGVRRRRR